MKDPLLDSERRLQFAGHETFPLRLLWLKKSHDALMEDGPEGRTFREQAAIARFGVGKNMVASMRHWAIASGMVTADGHSPTDAGRLILDQDGLDPYIEMPTTLWLIHAALAGSPSPCTTFYYAFNLLNQTEFDRESLHQALGDLARRRSVRATADTIKRDVEVFLRSYVGRGSEGGEDAAEPLLAELGLIRDARLSGQYEFIRGPQPDLPDAVFSVQLQRFWRREESPPTLSAEAITYSPGSPGRVFKMDEDSVVTRLMRLGDLTKGAQTWTDTAGLRQVSFAPEGLIETAMIETAYRQANAA